MEKETVELARQERDEKKRKGFSCTTLTLRTDGSIELFSHDIGPGVEAALRAG